MCSILMFRSITEDHFECPPNKDAKMYDEAVEELTEFCEGIDLLNMTSLKFHVNTWGLSSNNYFADEIIPKMKKLAKIDFSDTVKY